MKLPFYFFLWIGICDSVTGFSKPSFFHFDPKTYSTYADKWKKTQTAESYSTFCENVEYINQHNAKNDTSYILNVNEFTDMNEKDLKEIYFPSRFPPSSSIRAPIDKTNSDGELPSLWDWREKNVVTPVKNQGPCGSCWAFSAVGAIEGKAALKTGNLINLSDQMVVDCSISNYGCRGGLMHTAFDDIVDMEGLTAEKDYTYFARRGACSLEKPRVPGSSLYGYDFLRPENVDALKRGVNKRPISIALAADSRDFMFYGGGILDNQSLSTEMNHAVLLVGYSEAEEVPYWIIKNSWGTDWGEDGYIRIKMCDGKGVVGMNQYTVYPF